MQDTLFRAGQWVVYGDAIGILFQRHEFQKDERGRLTDDRGEPIDTSDPSAIARAPRISHIDFHPVDDKGETVQSGIVYDVIMGMDENGQIVPAQVGGRRSVYGSAPIGLRAARYDEIPASRQAGDKGSGDARAFHRFGYEGAPEPPAGEPENPTSE